MALIQRTPFPNPGERYDTNMSDIEDEKKRGKETRNKNRHDTMLIGPGMASDQRAKPATNQVKLSTVAALIVKAKESTLES